MAHNNKLYIRKLKDTITILPYLKIEGHRSYQMIHPAKIKSMLSYYLTINNFKLRKNSKLI